MTGESSSITACSIIRGTRQRQSERNNRHKDTWTMFKPSKMTKREMCEFNYLVSIVVDDEGGMHFLGPKHRRLLELI